MALADHIASDVDTVFMAPGHFTSTVPFTPLGGAETEIEAIKDEIRHEIDGEVVRGDFVLVISASAAAGIEDPVPGSTAVVDVEGTDRQCRVSSRKALQGMWRLVMEVEHAV